MNSLNVEMKKKKKLKNYKNLLELMALKDEIEDGDVLLIKGTNATGLGRLAKRLKTKGQTHAL